MIPELQPQSQRNPRLVRLFDSESRSQSRTLRQAGFRDPAGPLQASWNVVLRQKRHWGSETKPSNQPSSPLEWVKEFHRRF
jgi:hypothetical protein